MTERITEAAYQEHYGGDGLTPAEGGLAPLPRSTPDTWVTREGKLIPIVEMGDQHLLNTIAMLRRGAPSRRMRLDRLVDFLMPDETDWLGVHDATDGAALYGIEQACAGLRAMTDDEFLALATPAWPGLLAEANRRGLLS